MKYLEDAQLSQLTSELTTAILPGTNRRVLNGRIEAYITKRAGTDKKIASELNDRYVSELERSQWETEEWRKRVLGWQQQQQQKQSKSQGQGKEEKTDDSEQHSEKEGGEKEEGSGGGGGVLAGTVRASSENSDEFAAAKERKRDAKRQRRRRTRSVGSEPDGILRPPSGSRSTSRRSRSASFDVASARAVAAAAASTTTSLVAPGDRLLRSISDATRSTPLGDFHETSTRRLLTDLILTLNASFPDYDFSDAKPSHFAKIPTVKVAWNRIVERLSEYAAFRSSSGINSGGSSGNMKGLAGTHHPGGPRRSSNRSAHVGSSGGSGFLSRLYAALDDVASLADCDVYSYAPPPEAAGDGGTDDDEIDPLGFLAQTLAAEEMEVMEDDGGNGGEGDGRISGGSVGSSAAVVSAEERDVDGDVVLLDGSSGGVDGASAAPVAGSQRKRHHADDRDVVDGIVTPVDATATGIVRRSARSTPSVVPLWSFNYFFVNRSLKRIVLFAAVLTMTNEAGRIDIDEEDDFVADVTAGATAGSGGVRGDGGAMTVEDVSPSASGEVGVAGAMMMGAEDEDGFGVDTPMKAFGGGAGGGIGERGGGSGGAYDASSLSGYYSIDTEHSSVAASEEGGTFDMDESGTGPGTMGGSVPPPHPPIGAT